MSQDRQFFDTFMLVLGILVAFTIAIYLLANYVGGKTQKVWVAQDPDYIEQAEERLAPIGRVVVAGEASGETEVRGAVETVVAVATPETPVEISGEEVYNSACLACHAMGIAGAPKLGDVEGWAPRIAQGPDVLNDHAINGFQGQAGIMPAKGGRGDLSDEAVIAAVEYMTSQSQ